MHSKDPHKQSGPLFEAFWQEFDGILEEAGEGVAHFERFVFPKLYLKHRYFRAICRFDEATFTQEANFEEVTFAQRVVFVQATFMHVANFSKAKFKHDAHFLCSMFTQDAVFSSTTFEQNAIFTEVTFMFEAFFYRVTFMQDVEFRYSEFERSAEFLEATFMQNADFEKTVFCGTANWCGCRFLGPVKFRRTRFNPEGVKKPSAIFSEAKASQPAEVVFDGVDLSRALFLNCDVSEFWFTSSVQWAARKGNFGLAVFDESFLIEAELWKTLHQYCGPIDHRAVEQTYHQLKKNYDARLDYPKANDFHFGEMEMRRLAGPTNGRFLRLRQRLHRNLSLVAMYRYASDYGNSYGKPMLWLFGILVLSAALLPLPEVGLKRQGANQAETYASVWRTEDEWVPNLWAEVRLVGKSAITSVDTATFQKSAEYAPAYPWGRVLAIVETLVTSTLFALFLLAIRRQFRR
jgi:uncharacterized protein YjbI with pentapeptide repeats